MSSSVGGEGSLTSATITESCDAASLPRLIQHLKNPDHLVAYLVFTAWAKYMDVFAWIPAITIGG